MDFVESYRLKFRIDINNMDQLIKAELHLRKFLLNLNHTRRRSQKDRVDVNLFTPPNSDFIDGKPDYITTEFLDKDSISGLATFNVTEAIVLWMEASGTSSVKNGEIILDVIFRCPQDIQRFVPNFQFFGDTTSLVITTARRSSAAVPSQRTRRQITNSEDDLTFCSNNRQTCCLKKFNINFERDLNWTWVLHPKEISFNYCVGLCPINGVSYLHSQVLDLVRRLSGNPTAAGSPCCVPNRFRDKSFGMTVRGLYTVVDLPSLEATSCACR